MFNLIRIIAGLLGLFFPCAPKRRSRLLGLKVGQARLSRFTGCSHNVHYAPPESPSRTATITPRHLFGRPRERHWNTLIADQRSRRAPRPLRSRPGALITEQVQRYDAHQLSRVFREHTWPISIAALLAGDSFAGPATPHHTLRRLFHWDSRLSNG